MNHEYTEGCTCTSLLINGEESINLPIKTLKEAIIELVNSCDDTAILQHQWCDLVECLGEQEDLGYCNQCGDFITKYTLNI